MSNESSKLPESYSAAIHEAGKFIRDTDNGLLSIFKHLKNGVVDGFENARNGIAGAFSHLYNGVDDRLCVVHDQKTLLGEDFSSLYDKYTIHDQACSDGTTLSVFKSMSYSTEMVTDLTMLKSMDKTAYQNYNNTDNYRKAVYEVTLLSKKHANMFSSTDATLNDKTATVYADLMSQYQSKCADLGLEWNDVLTGVSHELQRESFKYESLSKELFTSKFVNRDAWENDRVLANRSHNMLISYAEGACPDFEDKQPWDLVNKMPYEDSLDVTPNPLEPTFFGKIVNAGKEFASKFVKKIGSYFGKNDKDSVLPDDITDVSYATVDDSSLDFC